MGIKFVNSSYKGKLNQPYEHEDIESLLATRQDGYKVFKKGRSVCLVSPSGILEDIFEWNMCGNQWRYAQQDAQNLWGCTWM
jgi:hypothetical protein